MSLYRIALIFRKDLFQGQRSFILIWGIFMPIILSFVLAAVFGTLTSDEPALGVVRSDGNDTEFVTRLKNHEAFRYRDFNTEDEMTEAVGQGVVDMGIILPRDIDSAIKRDETTEIKAYVWGESQAKNRTILSVTMSSILREMAGKESPIDINTVLLGDKEEIPWSVRVLPMLMLFAVFLGGVFIPSTSIIDEKTKKTMTALIVTPTTTKEVFFAKGLLGFVLSMFVGIIVLLLNNALGSQPLLLILTLALGAVMAVMIGMIFGTLMKDVSTLFAIWKTAGIILFGPAVIYLFPQIPQWIGRIFPTYYMLEPLMNITQRGAGWSDITGNLLILIAIDVVIFIAFTLILRRSSQFTV